MGSGARSIVIIIIKKINRSFFTENIIIIMLTQTGSYDSQPD